MVELSGLEIHMEFLFPCSWREFVSRMCLIKFSLSLSLSPSNSVEKLINLLLEKFRLKQLEPHFKTYLLVCIEIFGLFTGN